MKRFFVFLVSFVFLVVIAVSQTPEENFQKAGKAELAKREAVLAQKKAEIEKFFNQMGDDGVVSGEEMKTLKKMVKDFDKAKKNFDKELKFYNVETKTELREPIRKHLEIYFEEEVFLNYGDNLRQDIRRYFVEKTGQNVRIEKSKAYPERFLLGLILGFILAIVWGICVSESEVEARWYIGGPIILILTVIVFIYFL